MRNVLQKENQGTDPVVLPTQLSRFWNGMEIFLDDFPQGQWSLVQGYGGGFANGVRSVLLDNDQELKRSYLDALTQSQPCCQLNDVMLNNWPHTVAGVKDLSARRGISIYHNNASVHTVVGCSNDDSNTVPIAEGDHSFTTEAWIAPNHLTQPNHIFLSTVNQDKTTGYKLTAQQYQEGYKWSCHVEDQYNSASMTLTLFNQTTNGTTKPPFRSERMGCTHTSMTRKDSLQMKKLSCVSGSEDSAFFVDKKRRLWKKRTEIKSVEFQS